MLRLLEKSLSRSMCAYHGAHANIISSSGMKTYDNWYRSQRPDLVDNHIFDIDSDIDNYEEFEYYDPLSPGYIEPRRVSRLRFPREMSFKSSLETKNHRITKLSRYHVSPLIGLRQPWLYDYMGLGIVEEWDRIFPKAQTQLKVLYYRSSKRKEPGNWTSMVPTTKIVEKKIDLFWKDFKNLPVKSVLKRVYLDGITEPSILLSEATEKRKKEKQKEEIALWKE